jgi:hypothetical protein
MFNFWKKSSDEIQLQRFYTILSENDKVTYALANALDFCNAINVDISLLNRAADENHKTLLLSEVDKHQHFMGSIKLVYEVNNTTEKYRIIDGQHRFLALYDYYKNTENQDTDIKLLLELYQVDDVNGPEANSYFVMANTVKNIDYNRDIVANVTSIRNYSELVNQLAKYFPNTIKDNTRVHYPNISMRDLKEQLQEKNILDKFEIDTIIKKILEINTEHSGKNMQYFFGDDYRISKNYDKYLNAYTKCKTSGCWLGLIRIGKKFAFIEQL